MDLISFEGLKRLVEPFLEHTTHVYFTRYKERVYVGKIPALKYGGSEEEPTNFVLLIENITDEALTEMASKLNELEASRG